MTVNHGLYTDTLWAVAVTFTNAAGTALDLSGANYILDVISGGATIFSFKSTGGGATDGVIDLTDAATGQLNFTATEAQHASFNAGNYRVHLYTTATDSIWQATGKMLVGAPGAKSTYLTFDAVDNGAANVANPIELTGGGGGTWGSITGTLANQTDLQAALGLKLNASLISAYGLTLAGAANAAAARTVLGLGSLALLSSLAISDVTGLQSALDGKQAAGSYAASVHSHAIADVTGLQAALDAKLAASAISAFGLTLVDDADAATARATLGLGTAALSATGDFAAASHNHAASAITSGTIDTARLGSGTANSGTYLRGDQTWAAITATGDVVGPASATDNALVRYDATTGKLIQNSNATLSDAGDLALASAGSFGWSTDVLTWRDAANVLAMRNGTSPQTVRIYDTYTDGSNYERGFMRFSSDVFQIGTEKAGTGAAQNASLVADGTTIFIWGGFGSGFISFYKNPEGASNGAYSLGKGVFGNAWKNLYLTDFIETVEMTAPAAPAANAVRIYAQDNGAGKTQLMALFSSGAAQQIAIQP